MEDSGDESNNEIDRNKIERQEDSPVDDEDVTIKLDASWDVDFPKVSICDKVVMMVKFATKRKNNNDEF